MPQKSIFARSALILVSLAVASANLLFSCARGDPPEQSDDAAVTITFSCYPSEKRAYRALATEFQQTHPGIRVQIRERGEVSQGIDSAGSTAQLRALARAADSFSWTNRDLDQAARLELLLDLTPFVRQAGLRDEFAPELLAGLPWAGDLRILPAYVSFSLLYYDKQVFDAVGAPYPAPGWQWDDLLSTARSLAIHKDGENMQYGFTDLTGNILPAFVYQHGGTLSRNEKGLFVPTLDSPKAIESLNWYMALSKQHSVMPEPGAFDRSQLRDMAGKGQIAMWTDWAGVGSAAYGQDAFSTIGIAPLPQDEVVAHPVSVFGYAISAGTLYADETWQWIEFLSRHTTPLGGGSLVPAREALIESENYWQVVGEEAAQAIRYALNHHLPSTEASQFRSFVRDLSPVFSGEVTPQDFMTQAQIQALEWHSQRAAAGSQPVAVAAPTLAPADSENKIVFGVSNDVYETLYQQMAQAFMVEHPDIVVEVKNVAREWLSVDTFTMRENTDAFLWDGLALVGPDDQGVLNLTPLIEVDAAFSVGDILPGAMDIVRRNGQIWGLPLAADVRVILFDKNLFDRADVPYPDPGWTWDDLLEKAVLLTGGEGKDKQYGFASYRPASDLLQYIEGQCQSIGDGWASPPTYNLNSPGVKKAVRWWTALYREHDVMPPLRLRSHDYIAFVTSALNQRRVAMWTGQASIYDERWLYGPGDDPQLGIVPLPQGPCPVSFVKFQIGYISARTEKRDACWKWLQYLSQRLPAGRLAPVRRSLLTSDSFRERVGEGAADACLRALQTDTCLSDFDPAWPWFEEAIDAIAEGKSVDEALDEAQHKAENSSPGQQPW
jgi:ABC-type glycerol-3-phosphate transport system substrate-binding protein